MLLRLILSIVFAITWRKFKKTFPHRCLANYALIIQYRDSRCEFSIIPLISAFIDEQREKDFISTHFFFIPIFLHDPRSFLHNYSPTIRDRSKSNSTSSNYSESTLQKQSIVIPLSGRNQQHVSLLSLSERKITIVSFILRIVRFKRIRRYEMYLGTRGI